MAIIQENNNRKFRRRCVWFGRCEVRPLSNNTFIGDVRGAFINMLVWARSREEFIAKSVELFQAYGLDLLDSEEIEPITQRLRKVKMSEELIKIAKEVSELHGTRFGTVATYIED